jgi:hypothetical protein
VKKRGEIYRGRNFLETGRKIDSRGRRKIYRHVKRRKTERKKRRKPKPTKKTIAAATL